ncbi:MAG: 2-phosphosulfolactate phosphatase [Chloroflexota bacterium]
MLTDPFSQSGYRCRLEWGRRGACAAALRRDIIVIIDTLSFSTAVITAVHRGGLVYPCAMSTDAIAVAARVDAECAVGRRDVPHRGRFSLSAATYEGIAPGTRIVLQSPNGATCSVYGGSVPNLLIGALVNAEAVATIVTKLLESTPHDVTMVCAGERWKDHEEGEDLRFAIEDYLGAGAIISRLACTRSPEAQLCALAFQAVETDVRSVIWECSSGRELRLAGFGADVEHAARLNSLDTVPCMSGEVLQAFAR